MFNAGNSNEEDLENPSSFIYTDDPSLKCRFYRDKYPKAEDIVMGNIKNTDTQAEVTEVTLLEYDNKQGMLLHTELSRKMVKAVKRKIKVNHNEVVAVLRVDEKKGYIDLSKKIVTQEERKECEDRYKKAKTVHGILKRVALEQKMVLEDLYNRVGWPFYDLYGHAYDAFRLCLSNNPNLGEAADPFSQLDPPIDEHLKAAILKCIRLRLAPKPTKIRTNIEISSTAFEGINAIKDAIINGINDVEEDDSKEQDTDEVINSSSSTTRTKKKPKIEVELIASPTYSLQISSVDIKQGMDYLRRATEKIEEQIIQKEGHLLIKREPYIVSKTEEEEYKQMLEEYYEEMQEDYEEEDDDGDGEDEPEV